MSELLENKCNYRLVAQNVEYSTNHSNNQINQCLKHHYKCRFDSIILSKIIHIIDASIECVIFVEQLTQTWCVIRIKKTCNILIFSYLIVVSKFNKYIYKKMHVHCLYQITCHCVKILTDNAYIRTYCNHQEKLNWHVLTACM